MKMWNTLNLKQVALNFIITIKYILKVTKRERKHYKNADNKEIYIFTNTESHFLTKNSTLKFIIVKYL